MSLRITILFQVSLPYTHKWEHIYEGQHVTPKKKIIYNI